MLCRKLKDIGDAEKLSKDVKTQTKASVAKVEALKKQPVAVADNTNKTDSTKSSSPDVKELVKEDYTTINKKYSDEITSTNKIENEGDREKAKSEILKKWNTTIDAKIEKQKEDLKAITNENDKKAAEKNIAEAETLSNDVKTQTQESVARVETLKQKENAVANTENKQSNENSNKETNNKTNDSLKKNNEPIATNTKPETNNKPASTKINITSDDTFETINKKYDEGITNTDNITGELEKEKAISEMLKDWKTAVDNKIKTQKEELKKVKDTEQKKEITKNIKDAEQKSKEIKKQSDESLAKVTDLKKKQNAVAVNADNKTSNNPTDASSAKVNKDTVKSTDKIKQPVAANKQPESPGNNNETIKTDSAGGAIPVTKAATAEKQSFYTSPKAIEEIAKVDLINKQSDEILTQARELKTKAAEEKNEETKTSMIEQADALVKQADSKKAEANIAAATANKSEYNYNQNQIEQLANLSKNNKSDEIAMADMLNDESKIYYNKAEKSRKAADSVKAGYEKETALIDANSNELLALEKQKKAIDIYKKYNPDFVASATDKSSETKTNNNLKTNKTTATANKTNKNGVAANNNVKPGNENKTIRDKNPVASNVQKDTSDTSNTENTVASAANSPDNKTADNVSNSTKNGNENKDENTRDNSTSGNVNPIDNSTSNNTENESKKNSKKDSLLNAVANNITKTNVAPPVNKETNTLATKPIVNNKTTAIKLAPNESFEKKTIAVYSAKKPIPVNEKLPEGLVFKVQIGAFKKPIPQDLFKGITPITGETTTQGFTRYTAGVFIKFATADFAKNQIRDFGYKDAFVVAFLNGKRISMSQALSMAGIEFAASANTQTPTAAVTNTTTTTATQPAAANNNKETSNNQPAAIKEINEIAPATNISAIGGGLFYTVQVGVFSLPVSSAKLYNVTSLYTETAPNGNLRYNVGVFSNTARAVEAKNILIETGIKDAFVTAYYNGKRISLADAKQLETQGNITFSSGPNVNTLPKFSISNNGETIVNETQPNKEKLETRIENKEPTEKAVNPETKKEEPKTEKKETRPKNEEPKAEKKEPKPENEEQPIAKKEESAVTSEQPAPVIDSTKKETADKVASNNPPATEAGVVFKVQIGAFKDEVPLDIANKFLKVASKGIKNYKDENGLTIYTVGSYKTYEEAAKMKSELADSELNDAFIVAYKDGKKISVEEAKEK